MNKLFHVFKVDAEEANRIPAKPDQPHNQANIKLKEGYCFKRRLTLYEMMHAEPKQEITNFAIVSQLLSVLMAVILLLNICKSPLKSRENSLTSFTK